MHLHSTNAVHAPFTQQQRRTAAGEEDIETTTNIDFLEAMIADLQRKMDDWKEEVRDVDPSRQILYAKAISWARDTLDKAQKRLPEVHAMHWWSMPNPPGVGVNGGRGRPSAGDELRKKMREAAKQKRRNGIHWARRFSEPPRASRSTETNSQMIEAITDEAKLNRLLDDYRRNLSDWEYRIGDQNTPVQRATFELAMRYARRGVVAVEKRLQQLKEEKEREDELLKEMRFANRFAGMALTTPTAPHRLPPSSH